MPLLPTIPARTGNPSDADVAGVGASSIPACTGKQSGMSREAIYTAWLAERLAGAATLEECRLSSFTRNRAVRGDGPGPEGPDATLQGVFSVHRPEVLARRLRGGVGRHRAYGYGMLLFVPRAGSDPIGRGRSCSIAIRSCGRVALISDSEGVAATSCEPCLVAAVFSSR